MTTYTDLMPLSDSMLATYKEIVSIILKEAQKAEFRIQAEENRRMAQEDAA